MLSSSLVEWDESADVEDKPQRGINFDDLQQSALDSSFLLVFRHQWMGAEGKPQCGIGSCDLQQILPALVVVGGVRCSSIYLLLLAVSMIH